MKSSQIQLVFIPILIFFLSLWYGATLPIGDFQIDDVYITFSFAKNVALGNGPVFSGGRLPVEGYSTFLWVFILGGAFRVFGFVNAYPIARTILAFHLFLLMAFTYLLCRMNSSRALASLVIALLGFNLSIWVAVWSGMETVAFSAWLVMATYFYLRSNNPGFKQLIFFIPAALLRFEGISLLSVVCCCHILRSYRRSPLLLPTSIFQSSSALLLWLIYFIWRYSFYGYLLPLPFYAKRNVSKIEWDGLSYLVKCIIELGLIPVLLLGVGAISFQRTFDKLLLFLLILCQIALILESGGDWMPFHRFLLPVLPFLLVLAAWGAEYLLSRSMSWGFFSLSFAYIAGAFGSFALLNIPIPANFSETLFVNRFGFIHRFGNEPAKRLLPAMEYFNAISSPEKRIVTDYAGVFGFFTNFSVIDMWGLCNPEIAIFGSHVGVNRIYGKTCPECYHNLNPDYFHAGPPLLKEGYYFKNKDEVINFIWQSASLNQFVGYSENYVAGRVRDPISNNAVFFLERVTGIAPPSNHKVDRFLVEYLPDESPTEDLLTPPNNSIPSKKTEARNSKKDRVEKRDGEKPPQTHR